MGDMSDTTLLDLLGRRWTLGAPVRQIAIDRAGSTVGFGLANGRVALAPVEDADSALKRFHRAGDTGRATIAPRRRPPPPLMEVVLEAEEFRLAAFAADFVAGGGDGRLHRIGRDGSVQELGVLAGPVTGLMPLADGSVLASGDRLLRLHADGRASLELAGHDGSGRVCAATADGRWLAQGDEDLVIRSTVGPAGDVIRLADLAPHALAWSSDGRWLAAGLEVGGLALLCVEAGHVVRRIDLPNYPAPVRSLSWDAMGRLATSGAFRIIVWDLGHGAENRPPNLPTGSTGLVVVERVAFNPKRPLVAATLETGTIVVAPVGGPDELVVRPASADPITDLAWTPDGQHLAFGTRGGEAVLVTFPPQLFKF